MVFWKSGARGSATIAAISRSCSGHRLLEGRHEMLRRNVAENGGTWNSPVQEGEQRIFGRIGGVNGGLLVHHVEISWFFED